MKWISAILAILVLALSVQPVCAANPARAQVLDACCADDCSEEKGDDRNHHGDSCKTCNPFQSCACCAGGVVMPQVAFTILPLVPAIPALLWGQPAASASEGSLSGFWQPPKRA